ncbi:ATP synthase subunit I [Desulfuromonas acetoxidans]|uniref:ATP synthase I chain n=1 Tax=Desulfuromonas acetoxidans (strain DSM 684 / 11070) TaxID=281689 RepID=Q1JZI4_DESA6|nr:ATP synthase subunit I [Desulfuromonas acetoxidans]EAT15583.1 conserved hypothetical protein [Desulfuromonas acetoxidans DSM 684]MBF0646099.1 ATP synthase subunit I [Desulfuromonas acetoxidans]NVD25175.1 ATP synthase subunit I [Desulfuromonas acetoxidans]NVE17203.1 ATP synthase subunit I [Desulfuromonas acetoxidans]
MSDDQLLGQLARRNWIILAVLVALSGLFQDLDLTLGVASGGLIAVCGYQWLHRSLVKALCEGGAPAVRGFQLSYVFRLAALAVMLLLLIAVVKVDPIGLVIGLSVVVINIMWTTIKRAIK